MHFSALPKLFVASLALLLTAGTAPAENATKPRRVPLIDITDLYHPYQDVGDNVDLIAAYSLPEVDLRAVILDITGPFRQQMARIAGLPEDGGGPREAGFIPVLQLNSIFGRNVPCACGPFSQMRSNEDKLLDAPAGQQEGVDLLLRTLRESAEPVEIVSFGSARPLAVAYNRDPKLLEKKVRRIHLSAGSCEVGFLEWNVALDPHGFVRLLQSPLPIAIYPCGTKEGAFAVGRHNTYWKLENLKFIDQMAPPLQRYLVYAFTRSPRNDFLRCLEEEPPRADLQKIFERTHNVWETAIWLNVTRRKLVRHRDGSFEIVAHETESDVILPNDLRPCHVNVRQNGDFTFEFVKRSNLSIYDRVDAEQNQRALREAFPKWYTSIRP